MSEHPFDQMHVAATIARLQGVIERRAIRQQDLVTAVGIEKTKLSKWLNKKVGWSAIGAEDYRRLLDYVEAHKIFDADDLDLPDHILLKEMAFHGLLRFFDVDMQLLKVARDKLVGHYVSFRYSYYAAPHILKGHFQISYDEETRALKTEDLYRIPKGKLGTDSAEINFRRLGYIWPLKMDMYMVIAEKVDRKDVQIIYLNKPLNAAAVEGSRFSGAWGSRGSGGYGGDGTVQSIEGVLMDWQGPDFYMTKIFLQKVDERPKEDDICLLTQKEAPPLVLAKLTESFMGPHKSLRAYK